MANHYFRPMLIAQVLEVRYAVNWNDPLVWSGQRASYSSDGLLKLTPDHLVVQYNEVNYAANFSKTERTLISRELPLTSLERAEYATHWTGGRIRLVFNDLAVCQGLMGTQGNVLRVQVKRGNRGLAESFVSSLQLRLSEVRLGQ